ncbi:MAG: hypothetical protein JO104_10750 [Candidatus Eremiobacteraeota bacterium]|nr:hypothetical protein [Candidatus Eremiobacteraeota bacterium]
MNYVEWLRVRNVLRIVAIVLAILVALAVILRISVARYMSPEAWVAHMALNPTAHTSHTTLPDGTKRTVIDDPAEKMHVIIDDHGYAGKHIVVTEPSSRAHKESSNVNVGSVHVIESPRGDITTTVIDTNGAVPMIYYMALADVMALIVATILAAPFAREVDGHLEVALTRPCSRIRYALGVIAADVAGIIAASVVTVVAFYLCQLLFESARLDFSGINARAIAMGVALPLAWYAMLCAATTWLSRSYGAVLGFAWPVAILVGVLTLIPPGNIVALFVHDVAWVLSRLDPLTYVSIASPESNGTVGNSGFTSDSNFGLRFALELLFFVVYGALAIVRWQRVEA